MAETGRRWVGEQLRKAVAQESTRWITERGKRKRVVLDRIAEARRIQAAKTPEDLAKRISWLQSFTPTPAELILQAELKRERLLQPWWRRLLPMTAVLPEPWAPPARPAEPPPVLTETLPVKVPAAKPPAAPERPNPWRPAPVSTWRPPTILVTPVVMIAGVLALMAKAVGLPGAH